jgi:hypothetical protein
MRRPSVLRVGAVVLLLLAVAWVAGNTEWGEVAVPTPLRGEAATNPFYAAQQLVEALGATAERRETLGRTATDAIVVVSTWGWDLDSARRTELERWVEGGGRLVVDAALISGTDAFEQWSGVAREREEVDPSEKDLFRAPEIVEPCRSFAKVLHDQASEGVNGEQYELCDFDYESWLVPARGMLWSLGDDGYRQAVRVAIGRGTVTVVNGVPFVYRELFEGDHGELLVMAADLTGGDHVVFMSEADVAALPQLVWQHGAPVVTVLLLFIALALWRGAVRFGPLLPPVEPARRSLAEQVLGTGRFAVRVGGGAALADAARRALHEAAARRIAGYERLAADARADSVAKLAEADARELAGALALTEGPRPMELHAMLALLESARRQLVSRSQWSKHGKRI